MSLEKRNGEEPAPETDATEGRPIDGHADRVASRISVVLAGSIGTLLRANFDDLTYHQHSAAIVIETYARATASDLIGAINHGAYYCQDRLARSVEEEKKEKLCPTPGVTLANWPAPVTPAGKRQEVLNNFLEVLRIELIDLLQDPHAIAGHSESDIECFDFRKASRAQLCGNEADKVALS